MDDPTVSTSLLSPLHRATEYTTTPGPTTTPNNNPILGHYRRDQISNYVIPMDSSYLSPIITNPNINLNDTYTYNPNDMITNILYNWMIHIHTILTWLVQPNHIILIFTYITYVIIFWMIPNYCLTLKTYLYIYFYWLTYWIFYLRSNYFLFLTLF